MTSAVRLPCAVLVLVAFLASCAQPAPIGSAWDRKSAPPTITPLMVDGRCTLVVQKEVSAAIALRIWTILQEADNGSH